MTDGTGAESDAAARTELGDGVEIRPARQDDHDAVAAFTRDTWEGGDYIPDAYPDWIEGDDKRTLVADAGDAIAGLGQVVLLSEHEAWGQGLRVNPEFRGHGVSREITYSLFDWAREQGAAVARNMVFSWNSVTGSYPVARDCPRPAWFHEKTMFRATAAPCSRAQSNRL